MSTRDSYCSCAAVLDRLVPTEAHLRSYHEPLSLGKMQFAPQGHPPPLQFTNAEAAFQARPHTHRPTVAAFSSATPALAGPLQANCLFVTLVAAVDVDDAVDVCRVS